ncbi:MAG: carboxypeptidase-like regulatory domain-containing protein [Bacteroidota bacterium]|nr:carboxypeptidase-like regulatory domain-containing protein [Bacteroidota bacterium]MDP4212116.1 carboxypeptidase-like regulatory domain-containing protein [Bacteroidota bacterium]MDP4249490.1 carboxypeptidase-like regulatory domain-containing protein [Bacteroidota bacterium]
MRIFHTPGFLAMIFAGIIMCFGFQIFWNSPVKGSVTPSDAGIRAWIISPKDTLSAPVLEGNFMIENVKPGNYTLMIEGRPPYRNSFKEGVTVVDGQPTDAGVIQMNK